MSMEISSNLTASSLSHLLILFPYVFIVSFSIFAKEANRYLLLFPLPNSIAVTFSPFPWSYLHLLFPTLSSEHRPFLSILTILIPLLLVLTLALVTASSSS
eukprot:NODE_448_length_8440_cov_0.772329.p8 type:complete len:101 gc:universal NODE_448_length_8440_cov_0.772329:4227-4529(+)